MRSTTQFNRFNTLVISAKNETFFFSKFIENSSKWTIENIIDDRPQIVTQSTGRLRSNLLTLLSSKPLFNSLMNFQFFVCLFVYMFVWIPIPMITQELMIIQNSL